MGFFSKLIKQASKTKHSTSKTKHSTSKIKYSNRDIEVVKLSAQTFVNVINESLEIANSSKNPDTKLSRLSVAKDKLKELKKLAIKFVTSQ